MYIHLGTLLFVTPASGFFPLIFEKNNNGLDSVTRETGKGSIVAFGTSIARRRHDR